MTSLQAYAAGMKKTFTASRTLDFRGHTDKLHAVAWTSDGRKFATASLDKTARIWQLERPSALPQILLGHTGGIDQLCWDPKNAERLATCSSDKTVRLWDSRTQKATAVVETQGENINVDYHPDGNIICVGDKEDLLYIIDVRKGAIIDKKKFNSEINEFSFSSTGDSIFLTKESGLTVLSYPSLKESRSIQGHMGGCVCIDFDPKGRYCVTGSLDSTAMLWDLSELVCLRAFTAMDYPLRSVSISHDSKLVASGAEDKFVDIALLETGQSIFQLPAEAAINCVAWHPSKHILAYVTADQSNIANIFGA